MINKIKFAKELITAFIIASLFSFTVTFLVSFVLFSPGVSPDSTGYTATIGAALWGLFVG
jgi:hypothetical protein